MCFCVSVRLTQKLLPKLRLWVSLTHFIQSIFIGFQMYASPRLLIFKLSTVFVTPWSVCFLAVSSFGYLVFAAPGLLIIASPLA